MQKNSECHRRRGEVENIVADYEIKVAKGNQEQFKTVYIAELQKKVGLDNFLSCNNLFQGCREVTNNIFTTITLRSQRLHITQLLKANVEMWDHGWCLSLLRLCF